MARQVRFELANARYLITARGNRSEPVFRDDADRDTFLATLDECRTRSSWRIEAYALLTNRFHLVLVTESPNLAMGMKWLLGTYTRRFNLRSALRGHVFEGRYRSLIVDTEQPGAARDLVDYVHLAPARDALPQEASSFEFTEEALRANAWCSYRHYAAPGSLPAFLSPLPFESAPAQPTPAAMSWQDHTASLLDLLRTTPGREELELRWSGIRRGWCLGSDAFRARLLGRVGVDTATGRRTSYGGAARAAHDEAMAREALKLGLQSLERTATDLKALPKGAPEKQALAWLLRTRTMAEREWIAAQLDMGDPSRVTQACAAARSNKHPALSALCARLSEIRLESSPPPTTRAKRSASRPAPTRAPAPAPAPEPEPASSNFGHSLAPDFLD